MAVKYWYKSQESEAYQDVSNLISVHISGGESINELPGGFRFTLQPYKKNSFGQTLHSGIDINIGDKFLILDGLNFISQGSVFDPGRNLVFWDKTNDRAVCIFEVSCIQDDFSNYPISEKFENTNLVSILDVIMSNTDNTLNSGFGKYVLTIENFDINSFNIDKKTAREALTELCENYDLFWRLEYEINPHPTKIFDIKRYVIIGSKEGNSITQDNTWYGGILNNHVSKGTLQNPILENLASYPIIPAEQNFKVRTDSSVIINFIDLNCKVFQSEDTGELTRYTIDAEPNKFEYELNGYASDLVYCSQWTKESVKILSGSTSSIIKLESRFCVNLNIGNIATFSSHSNQFFEVFAKSIIDDFITEIAFIPALPFTPVVGSDFEIVSNIPIYRKESEINYSNKGCLVDIDQKNFTKVKFLPLSEPNSSMKIIFYYKKISDFPLRLKNDESIQRNGLRYKEVKIDDEIILTQEEANILASKLLTLKPVYTFTFDTRRYGLAPVGMSLTVKIDNLITENFVLTSNEWTFSGAIDYNKKSQFLQQLTFSTNITNTEKIIERLRKSKKSTSSQFDTKEKNLQSEKINILEFITWQNKKINLDAPTPYPVNIVSYSFYVDWNAVSGADFYRLQVAFDSNFNNPLTDYNNIQVFVTSKYVFGPQVVGSSVFYARVKAFNNQGLSSEWSQGIKIDKNANLKVDLDFANNGLTDLSGFNNNLINVGSILDNNGILPNENQSLYLDGINDYSYINYNSNIDSQNFTVEFVCNILQLEFISLVGRYDHNASNNYLNDIFTLNKDTNNTILIYLYDNTTAYFPPFGIFQHKYAEIKTNYKLLANNTYAIQFSYNNSTKDINIRVNNMRIKFTATVGGGYAVSLASLNINVNTARLLLGAFIDFIGVNQNNTAYYPNIRYSKFRYYTKSHTQSELADMYNSLVNFPTLRVSLNFKNGSIQDNSIFNNDAVLVGATMTSNPVLTQDSQSLYLDGTNDYAVINYNTSLDTESFTVEIVFTQNGLNLESFEPIVTRYDGVNPIWAVQMDNVTTTTADIYIILYDTATGYLMCRANNVVLNSNYNVIQFSYDNDNRIVECRVNNSIKTLSFSSNSGLTIFDIDFDYTQPLPIYLGAYGDPSGVNQNNSNYFPNIRFARFNYHAKAHTQTELATLYTQLINS